MLYYRFRLTIERCSPRPMTPVREEPAEPAPTKLPPLVNPPVVDQGKLHTMPFQKLPSPQPLHILFQPNVSPLVNPRVVY